MTALALECPRKACTVVKALLSSGLAQHSFPISWSDLLEDTLPRGLCRSRVGMGLSMFLCAFSTRTRALSSSSTTFTSTHSSSLLWSIVSITQAADDSAGRRGRDTSVRELFFDEPRSWALARFVRDVLRTSVRWRPAFPCALALRLPVGELSSSDRASILFGRLTLAVRSETFGSEGREADPFWSRQRKLLPV